MYWYKRDPNAALTGMLKLSLEQRGLYNSLLDLLYAQNGVVADDDLRLARQLGVQHQQYRRIKAELIASGKLSIVDGHLQCPRVEATLKAAHRQSRQQSRVRMRQSTPQLTPQDTPQDTPQQQGTFLNDFNAPCPPPRTQTQQERNYRETYRAGAGSNGSAQHPLPLNPAMITPAEWLRSGHQHKPRHGQRSPRGRIWFDAGTLEFEAHSDDYRNAHHGLDPPMQWENQGAWFEIAGEGA